MPAMRLKAAGYALLNTATQKNRNAMAEKENVLIEDVLGAGETVDAKHKTTIHK
jgi:hypothetical protein